MGHQRGERLEEQTERPGERVSAFHNEHRGLDLEISNEVLKEVNRFRATKGCLLLEVSPRLRSPVYVKNQERYLSILNFEKQPINLMDVL